MKPIDFQIGDEIIIPNGQWWRVVDIGQLGIAAIKLTAPDESWYVGPPYGVAADYWDQYDIDGIEKLRRNGVVTEVDNDL